MGKTALRESFLFRREYAKALEIIAKVDKMSALRLIDALYNYAFYDMEFTPDTPIEEMAWMFIKPKMDADLNRHTKCVED